MVQLSVLMEAFVQQKKKFSVDFSKLSTKLCLILHYNTENSYLFVNGKEIFKFKADNENVNFSTQLCLGSIFIGFSATEPREVSLKRNVYDFSVDYNSIDKYLMIKSNIK